MQLSTVSRFTILYAVVSRFTFASEPVYHDVELACFVIACDCSHVPRVPLRTGTNECVLDELLWECLNVVVRGHES